MKNIKILILLLTVGVGFQKTYAQPIRFKTSSVSFTEKQNDGSWNEWSDFLDANVLITLDPKKDSFVINSAEVQSFKIHAYGDIEDTEELNIVPFECTDNKFSKCKIFIITKKKENNRMQIYVNYNEVKFVYNIYNSN